MSATSVKSAIITKLNSMSTLKSVYGYEASNIGGLYPLACVTFSGGEGEFASTAQNLRRRNFIVRVYQEKGAQGSENAENIIGSIIDEIENAFDMDTTLTGACQFATPISWSADYADREVDVRLLTIIIQAVELVSAS